MGPRPQGYGDPEGDDCSHAREKPPSTAETSAPHPEVQSLDENTRHCEHAAIDQQFEDNQNVIYEWKESTEGVKRVTLAKRHLDGVLLMTRGTSAVFL